MKSTELARQIKKPATTISGWIREGRFKTSKKVFENHQWIWVIDDDEAKEFIAKYLEPKTLSEIINWAKK